jgi:RNA recognition motif-containing protein
MKNIYVGNLDFQTTEEVYGQVDRVSIATDRDSGVRRGFGFIEMTNDVEGGNAIAGLNGATLGTQTLKVNEARPKRERSFSGGGGGRSGGNGRY